MGMKPPPDSQPATLALHFGYGYLSQIIRAVSTLTLSLFLRQVFFRTAARIFMFICGRALMNDEETVPAHGLSRAGSG